MTCLMYDLQLYILKTVVAESAKPVTCFPWSVQTRCGPPKVIAPAMNKQQGVSAGRCPVTLMRREATPSITWYEPGHNGSQAPNTPCRRTSQIIIRSHDPQNQTN